MTLSIFPCLCVLLGDCCVLGTFFNVHSDNFYFNGKHFEILFVLVRNIYFASVCVAYNGMILPLSFGFNLASSSHVRYDSKVAVKALIKRWFSVNRDKESLGRNYTTAQVDCCDRTFLFAENSINQCVLYVKSAFSKGAVPVIPLQKLRISVG